MSQGRHRKPNETTTMAKIALGTTVGLGAVVVPATFAGPATAATASEWDQTAQCESSGHWNYGPDNQFAMGWSGYYGGLQFSQETWAAYGGTAFAARADLATKEQQITIAERVLTTGYNGNAPQGAGAWPVCGVGLSHSTYSGSTSTNNVPPPVQSNPPTSTPSGSVVPAPGSKADIAIKYAIAHISSAQYLLGGNGPLRFDCSGLTSQAWKAAGVDFTQSARDSWAQEDLPNYVRGATYQTLATIKPGDLVAFNNFEGGHVALYTGPIGPGGADMIDTGSRHPGSGVNWSTLATRGSQPTGITRPAPFVGASTSGGNTGGSSTGTTVYTVKRGDYLSKIATALGVKGGWHALYTANKGVIGSNPNLIYPGQKLKVPGATSTPSTPKPTTPTPAPSPTSWSGPLASLHVIEGYGVAGSMWSLGYHTGVDFQASTGTPVLGLASGTVVGVNAAGSSYGNHVVVKYGDGQYALYAHLSSVQVSVGQAVTKGQTLGLSGNTGNSTGPHLHFELRNDPSAFKAGVFSDPVPWLKSHGVTVN